MDMIRSMRRFGGQTSAVLAMVIVATVYGPAQQTALQLDPAKTTVRFTLDAALHTVHGSFQVKQSTLQFDPASGRVSGEVLVDAKSGQTGNGMRDRKMNNDVLESSHYPEITFHLDHITGMVASQGMSSVTVHGTFNIHGVDREITIPAHVDMDSDHWTATAYFTIPYAKWGMKNPSTFFLRVGDTVEIEVAAGGSVVKNTSSSIR
jgi:polyisoprenoid-binding protein YceI